MTGKVSTSVYIVFIHVKGKHRHSSLFSSILPPISAESNVFEMVPATFSY